MAASATKEEDKVQTPSVSWKEMAVRWDLPDTLRGGTLAMRAAKERYLPRETEEKPNDYQIRLGRSVLLGAYNDTVKKISGKPFVKPVTIEADPDLPDQLISIVEDVDRTGKDLTMFGQEVLEEAVHRGHTHIFVDFPQMMEGATMKEERESGARPVFIHITAKQLIGWRTKNTNGGPELTEIRWHYTSIEDKGDFGDEKVEFIQIFRAAPGPEVVDPETGKPAKGTWAIYKKTSKDEEFILDDAGTHTYEGGVPMVTLYTERSGFMTSTPPLEDLAWKNLEHWQSSSDQRNILRFSRMGLLFAAGWSEDEVEEGITVAPNSVTSTTNPDGKLTYVEHQGHAIQAGERDLKDLQEQMEILGLQPMMTRVGGETATGRAIDEARSQSLMQSWIRNLERVLEEAYIIAGKWVSVELDSEKFTINIFNEFGLGLRSTEDIDALIKARTAGEIPRHVFLSELKRRGLLSDQWAVEDLVSDLEEEQDTVGDTTDEDEEEEDKTGGSETTGETDGHTHTYKEGDTETSKADGHTHAIDAQGNIQKTDGHTHTP